MKVLTNKAKIELKEQKLNLLKKIFENITENKKALVTGLIEQYAFMYVQLKELNEIIEKKGVVENFKQGKQQFIREQPAVKAYNALIKNYNITIKQLSEFLPPGNSIPMDDEFERFKQRRNK